MKYFVKLHVKLLDSETWHQSLAVRALFIALLLKADENGNVTACREAMIKAAHMSQADYDDALETLVDLGTVVCTEGEIEIPNYNTYKASRVTGDPESDGARRTRKWRENKKLNEDKTLSKSTVTRHRTTGDVTSYSLSNNNKKEQPPARRRWRTVPEDWEPNDGHRQRARELGVDFDDELENFRLWEFKDPKTSPDKTFTTWLKRAKKNAKPQQKRSNVETGEGWNN